MVKMYVRGACVCACKLRGRLFHSFNSNSFFGSIFGEIFLKNEKIRSLNLMGFLLHNKSGAFFLIAGGAWACKCVCESDSLNSNALKFSEGEKKLFKRGDCNIFDFMLIVGGRFQKSFVSIRSPANNSQWLIILMFYGPSKEWWMDMLTERSAFRTSQDINNSINRVKARREQ